MSVGSPEHGLSLRIFPPIVGTYRGVERSTGRQHLLIELLGIDLPQEVGSLILHSQGGVERFVGQATSVGRLAGSQFQPSLLEQIVSLIVALRRCRGHHAVLGRHRRFGTGGRLAHLIDLHVNHVAVHVEARGQLLGSDELLFGHLEVASVALARFDVRVGLPHESIDLLLARRIHSHQDDFGFVLVDSERHVHLLRFDSLLASFQQAAIPQQTTFQASTRHACAFILASPATALGVGSVTLTLACTSVWLGHVGTTGDCRLPVPVEAIPLFGIV